LTWNPPAIRTGFKMIMVGVAAFEPATPASRTRRNRKKSRKSMELDDI
jgi:hypothetical protein